jgi:pimeloyl-ACP methyl ester carboxylesterase
VLFGHSMGCQVALECLRSRREDVRGLVLLCGSFGRVTETFHGTSLLAQALPKLLDAVEKRPGLTRALWSRIPAELALKTALLLKEVDPRTIVPEDLLPYLRHMTHVDFGMFLRMLRAAGEHTAEDLLPSIDVPVLVVAGEKDSFTPPHLAEFMVEQMPNAELLMLEGGTHVAPLEHRDHVWERIRRFFEEKVEA